MTFSTVLFDLDGTLTDPFTGITRSIQYALEKMGTPVPEAAELKWCIGPPLWESFAVLLNTADRALQDQAVAFYRERYTREGLFENTLISGISELVGGLAAKGCKLFVATSKPHAYAGKIVEHFSLMPHFSKVYGSELDGTRSAKAELIAYLMAQEGLSHEECVMIGDRKHDLIGARANQMASVGVTWGYGSRSELLGESPNAVLDTPAELGRWLDSGHE
ncbi:HAD family hydrolase [Roseibium suaedae]|uniref:Phosphoglycolate phosphatase n=1 Tax=Roseibium suaedae TaxID=735517 RepID=A0A1M7FRN9_9HYPH|nr:HAD family hydrolase [Roseibium suaedae]SHM06646.1 phosphoglycolate phosphatase [Roseibium suaedae]